MHDGRVSIKTESSEGLNTQPQIVNQGGEAARLGARGEEQLDGGVAR